MRFLKDSWLPVLEVLAYFKDILRGRKTPVNPIDRALGIETSRRAPGAAMATGRDQDAFSIGYPAGSMPSVIRKSLSLIGIERDADFIDLGCGKGRALIVAAEFPFRALIGIELVPYLCRIARRNVEKLRPRECYADRISILEGDASTPDFDSASTIVLFLYHPFRRPLVETLVAHIEEALSTVPNRKFWIVYHNPVYYDVFDACLGLKRYFAGKIEFDADDRSAAPFDNTYESVIIYQSRNIRYIESLPGAEAKVRTIIPDISVEVVQTGVVEERPVGRGQILSH